MTETTPTTEPKKEDKRTVPKSELDFAMLTVNSVWGNNEVSSDLKDKLSQNVECIDVDGKKTIITESLWGVLGYYTRDMRLANLTQWDGELEYVRYYIDLAGDMLHANMIMPFLIALSRAATRLELSQSRGGFLRKRLGTITEESTHREMEPPKKNLFGVGKKKEGGI